MINHTLGSFFFCWGIYIQLVHDLLHFIKFVCQSIICWVWIIPLHHIISTYSCSSSTNLNVYGTVYTQNDIIFQIDPSIPCILTRSLFHSPIPCDIDFKIYDVTAVQTPTRNRIRMYCCFICSHLHDLINSTGFKVPLLFFFLSSILAKWTTL